ncbi:hypothetical protein N7486_009072 [Penicillium sp. IBT 16267x]|jgi:hypothetical protein|nr:hypothetical protein N7486_009072 [Penicillium sp. IBT 16267x]
MPYLYKQSGVADILEQRQKALLENRSDNQYVSVAAVSTKAFFKKMKMRGSHSNRPYLQL